MKTIVCIVCVRKNFLTEICLTGFLRENIFFSNFQIFI